MVLGIPDGWIWVAYILCIISAIICVVYGIANWNKGAENETAQVQEEKEWEKAETQIDDNM